MTCLHLTASFVSGVSKVVVLHFPSESILSRLHTFVCLCVVKTLVTFKLDSFTDLPRKHEIFWCLSRVIYLQYTEARITHT